MLTPKYMEQLPLQLIDYFQDLENRILEDIAENFVTLTKNKKYNFEVMIHMGYSVRDIEKEIIKRSGKAEKLIAAQIKKAGLQSYENDYKMYKAGGKALNGFENNAKVQNLVDTHMLLGRAELQNITKTMGLAGEPLRDFYTKELSQAIIDVNMGYLSTDDAIKRVASKLYEKGLETISYSSGRNYSVDSAVRMAVNSTTNKMSFGMGYINAQDMGQDLMEITAHAGARPSHQDWQGQIVSLSGENGYLNVSDIGLGEADGFMGINCRHNWYPYFDDSTRVWSGDELQEIDNEPFEYNGKEYTQYEAGQRQRQFERSIRKSDRKIILFENSMSEDLAIAENIKRQRVLAEYLKFSNVAGLKERIIK